MKKIEILLVEDSDADAGLVRDWCHKKLPKLSIIRVSAYSEAVAILKSQTVDLILLDLNLPDSEGLETFDGIKNLSRAPVVILTGLDDEELGCAAVKEGAQDYLVKSHDFSNLCRSIRFALERDARRKLELDIQHAEENFSENIKAITDVINALNKTSE